MSAPTTPAVVALLRAHGMIGYAEVRAAERYRDALIRSLGVALSAARSSGDRRLLDAALDRDAVIAALPAIGAALLRSVVVNDDSLPVLASLAGMAAEDAAAAVASALRRAATAFAARDRSVSRTVT